MELQDSATQEFEEYQEDSAGRRLDTYRQLEWVLAYLVTEGRTT